MTTLEFKTVTMPAGHLGPAGDYPILWKQAMFEKGGELAEDEELFINYGNINHTLPYTSLDTYDHSEEKQPFEAAVLENDHLKAVFIPSLGGRLWSLYDKDRGEDLVINNPVFRPCNLAVRNAWFCGGVEWNCGVRGHSPLTCDKVYAASYQRADGTPVLRLYAFERIRAITFQMDFFLPEDSRFLFARMRLVNGMPEVTPIYWWSTIAVKLEEGGRVIVPADDTYVNQGTKPVFKAKLPYVEDFDASYPTLHKVATDHFYKLRADSRKYEAYVLKDGHGMIHASTRRLKGRKLFVWGSSAGGQNWQKLLTNEEGWKQPYLEIQAGLACTQNESLPFPPNSAWEWLEAYGAVSIEPEKVHGSFEDAKKNMTAWLDEALPESFMDGFLKETHADATGEAEVRCKGHPWGELDNRIKDALGYRRIAPYLDFGELEDEQKIWADFLETGKLAEPDPSLPPVSFMTQKLWADLLKKAVKGADKDNWYAWYHLGICAFAADDHERAKEYFLRSLDLAESTWGYHGLANCCFALGENEEGAAALEKAFFMNPDNLPFVKEVLRTFYNLGDFAAMRRAADRILPEFAADRYVRNYLAMLLFKEGRIEEGKALFAENPGPADDTREGDENLSWCYEEATGEEIPFELEFRMFHERGEK